MSEQPLTSLDLTPLAGTLAAADLQPCCGVGTPAAFTGATDELQALTRGVGVFDLGWRTRFRITGDDRGRWLNGMVTNTVKGLAAGTCNYTFLLNAQGRIQGDGEVYALPEALLFSTDHAQASRLQTHLDRFIIMDDVELVPEDEVTALGLAGPGASALLARLGLADPPLPAGALSVQPDLLIAQERPSHYTLWTQAASIGTLWAQLLGAGATACGFASVEALRVLEGVPRYGADIDEKSLAQETGQMRALNFNKGCYLGQEIVERIRSRATVHKGLRAFKLSGELPTGPMPLLADGKPVGELTSFCRAALEQASGLYALGTVRNESVGAIGATLHYDGGTAAALDRAPLETV